MEKLLMTKEKILKTKEKPEIKQEIIVKKRINLLNRLSFAKSPTVKDSNILKTKKYEKNKDRKNQESITKHKIKLPSELIAKKKMIDYIILNPKTSKKILLNNNQSEIEEKNITFKNNNEDKKKLLGQIITDFSSNRKLNNNIFDDGNQVNFSNDYSQNINNNTINNDMIFNNRDIKERNELNKTLTQTNNIQEIQINNFNIKNNNTNTNTNSNSNLNNKAMKLSISSSRGNYYKRKPFYILGINNYDKNNNIFNNNIELESPIKNNYKVEMRTSLSKNLIPSKSYINTESISENVRKRNKGITPSNSLTCNSNFNNKENKNIINNINKEINKNKYEGKDNDNKNKENKINNINNINNNISLNNRYNFYIKIGKNNNINKDNKDINYEIKLTSPTQHDKDDNSNRVIKKLIVECDIDKINKNLHTTNNNKKGINVNIKPLYKKIEIDKILLSNDNKEDTKKIGKNKHIYLNSQNSTNKTTRSLNKKSFKFLVHQAYKNRDLSTSFNRYYKSGQSLRGKSQSIRDYNYYNDSFNYSNAGNEPFNNNESNKPLGLKYYNSERKNIEDNENNERYKKYKDFYKSFRNIGRIKKQNNISYEENINKMQKRNNSKNNTNNIRYKLSNLTSIMNHTNKKKKDNLEITPVSISISNINDENNNNKNMANDNLNNNINDIENKNNGNLFNNNQTNTPESRLLHSKTNTSFSTNSINSNFNSINSSNNNTTNNNNNIHTKNNKKSKNNSSIPSSMSSNLSISFINLEILYVLQEKLKIILEKIIKYQRCSKECYEFINYYFTHHFYNENLKSFQTGQNRKIINKYMKSELLCYFLCYDISFTEDFKQAEILLKSIFSLLYKNFLIFLSLIISQYKNKENNIIIILNKIVKDNLFKEDLLEDNIDLTTLDENSYIEIINNNSKKINDYYKMIIENIYMKYIKGKNNYMEIQECINIINPNELDKDKLDIFIASFFIGAYKSITEYNFDLLKKFFYSFLHLKQKLNHSNISNIELNHKQLNNNNYIHEKKTHSLLPKIKDQKYSLVLDLDETLVYSQKNFYKLKNSNLSNINNDGINIPKKTVMLRPGLHEFLHDMKLLYELIIFSSGTPDYVDPIIKMIEKDEKYFDYILYRQHIIIDENGDKIKDLNLIGRDLKNVIIIDDISRYFKLQKENGICIRPFNGNILSDRKTLKTLNNVLQKIRFDADETKDIRISLDKYRHLLYPIVINNNE